MGRLFSISTSVILVLCLFLSGCGSAGNSASITENTAAFNFDVSMDHITSVALHAGVSVYDPSILKANGKYYIFGSHMAAAVSDDLRNWTYIGNGYKVSNPVFLDLMKNEEAFSYAGNKHSLIRTDDGGWHVWAPDVIYNRAMQKYVMYFCTSSTWNASNLCYAISDVPEGPYIWQGALIYSGFTEATLPHTDVLQYVKEDYAREHYMKSPSEYNYDDYPNAIDPTVFYDHDGRMWMVYGSWSGGIFLLEIDENTGKVIHPKADEENRVDPYFGKKLLGGGHHSIEGPYILYNDNTGYYELYVSYGGLNREGGYQIRVYRSKTVDGNYADMNGKYPGKNTDHANDGLKLSGNYLLPSLPMAYMATGHNSAFVDDDGKRYLCFHTRFDNATEDHEPRVHQYFTNEEGWPCLLPYETNGETIAEGGYPMEKMAGRYYIIDQGTAIDDKIATPVVIYLTEAGNVYDENGKAGTWRYTDQSAYLHIEFHGNTYSGIFCEMKDEANTNVLVFSAVGNNESIWGVKYQ